MSEGIFTWCYNAIADILAPPFCVSCRCYLFERVPLCSDCLCLLYYLPPIKIKITAQYDLTVYALGKYEEPLRSLILAKGHSNRLASRQLAELLWRFTTIKQIPIDYCVPIPLHWTRYAYRGFNQAAVMAEFLAQKKGCAVAPLLNRIRYTAPQSSQAAVQRQENVAHAFDLNNISLEQYKDKHLVLIDDLMTTGSTLRTAAQELIKLKPARISAIVACRTV
jgi:ComF family protein